MQTTRMFLMGLGALALGVAACSPAPAEPVAEAPPPAAAAPMADMPMPATPSPTAGAITGVGKVVEVDAATGVIKLDHEPIAALGWPSMSMAFTASDPALVAGVAVGDAVAFELKSAAESSMIIKLQKQ